MSRARQFPFERARSIDQSPMDLQRLTSRANTTTSRHLKLDSSHRVDLCECRTSRPNLLQLLAMKRQSNKTENSQCNTTTMSRSSSSSSNARPPTRECSSDGRRHRHCPPLLSSIDGRDQSSNGGDRYDTAPNPPHFLMLETEDGTRVARS